MIPFPPEASRVLVDFFLDMIPFLGCPTVLIKNTWAELRGISVIASLYGHDLNSARVQHEILICLVPQNDQLRVPGDSNAVLLSDTASKVAKAILKNAAERATGLRLAADVIELGTLLYNLYDVKAKEKETAEGYIEVGNAPTATARVYFKPKLIDNSVLGSIYLPMLLLCCRTFSGFRIKRSSRFADHVKNFHMSKKLLDLGENRFIFKMKRYPQFGKSM